MAVAPHPSTTSIFIVGRDSGLRNAVARLLSLDPAIEIVGSAAALTGREAYTDIVLDDDLLADLRDVSIGSFIDMVKELPVARPPRHLHPVAGAGSGRSPLSDRELQVVQLVTEGLSNKEIGRRLRLSDKTIKNHVSHILAKLKLNARTQLAVHALRTGLA